MKVIIKYKTELGRGVKYRAGSLQDLPDAEALKLIESGSAIPYQGQGSAITREVRVVEAQEVRVPVNNKRALRQAKIAREAQEDSKTQQDTEAVEIVETEASEEEGSEDGVKKNNRAKRKSNKPG